MTSHDLSTLYFTGIPTALGTTLWSEHFPVAMDIIIRYDAADDVTTAF